MSKWKEEIGKPDKIFYCAYHSLKDDSEKEKCLNEALLYLKGLSCLNKKEDWISNHLFKTRWNGKEIKNLAVVHVNAAKISLERLLILNPKTDNPIITEFLIDFICDLKYWMNIVDPAQDFSWLYLNTNNSTSHCYLMFVRSHLYGVDREKFRDHDARFITATLLIRHTIEQRIKGILGIDYILSSNRPVSLSNIIDAISNMSKLKLRKGIDFKRISKINDWANHHLHRGLRPSSWQQEWAEIELRKLFYIGQTSDLISNSIYASFETESIIEARKEFESEINKIKSDMLIKWYDIPEIYELKSTTKNR